MRSMLMSFARDAGGATAVEYGILCSLIFLAIVGSVDLFAGRTAAMFNDIASNYH